MCCNGREINCCSGGQGRVSIDEEVTFGKAPFFEVEVEAKRHGHPRFYELLNDIAQLHSDKNHDYAKGGDPLGNFKRRAALYARYPGLDLSKPIVVALVDAMKQLDAALWFLSNKHEAKVEALPDRLRDVSVYALIAMVLDEET